MLLCVLLNKQCFFNTINSLLLLNAAFRLESPELCGFGFVLHLQQVKAAARKESCSLPLFSPKAQRSTNATGLCKLSSHAPLSSTGHIFSMKEILYLLFVALVTKPLHHCLFVTWGLDALSFLHPCHRCCLSNDSVESRWISVAFALLDAVNTGVTAVAVFKQWNLALTMQKVLFFTILLPSIIFPDHPSACL